MHRTKKFASLICSLALAVGLAGCADETDQLLEEAHFLLDGAHYEEAAAKAQQVLDVDPANAEATFVLGSSLIAMSVLEEGETYLDRLALVLDVRGAGESDMDTFLRIAPAALTGDALQDLQDGRDMLLAVPDAEKTQVFWLQIYIGTMFEVAAAVTEIGANSEDNICNMTPSVTRPDGVPDSFSPTALSGEGSTRFRDNLHNANTYGTSAGLPEHFALNVRFGEMADTLDAAITAAGDADTGTADYLTAEFVPGGIPVVCP
jgi:hypothetical protein